MVVAVRSWLTLPVTVELAPTMDNWPPTEEAVTPTMSALPKAVLRPVAYCATVSPAVMAGAVMVAGAPVAVWPVMVRLVAGSTVLLEPNP